MKICIYYIIEIGKVVFNTIFKVLFNMFKYDSNRIKYFDLKDIAIWICTRRCRYV